MKTYARIENGVVVEIIDPALDADGNEISIQDRFHPDFVATLVQIPEDASVSEGWIYFDGEFSAPPSPPVLVPQAVTAAQGGIALINAGLMDAVQAVAVAADTPATVKWAWDRATTWERTSPALAYLADKAGITEKQMDDLFIAASVIQA